MKEIRCPRCSQLLLKANICVGEIKCTRCKEIIKINIKNDRVSSTTRNSE